MNDIFSAKRFWKYLVLELRNAVNRLGIYFLVVSLTPVIATIMINSLSLLFTGGFYQCQPEDTFSQQFEIIIATLTIPLVVPPKLYGKITNIRYGAGYLTFPVSVMEKSLSMILTLTIIPIAFYGIVLGWDALLCVALKSAYFSETPCVKTMICDNTIVYNILNLATLTLFFGYGAILFKRAKTVKTILCALALVVVLSIAMTTIPDHMDILSYPDYRIAVPPVLFLLLCTGIYFRIKTLKL